MQNDPHSHGLWERTAPPPPATSPLKEAVKADVAIVGAGFTGLSAALHLAESGSSVVLVEASDVGFGAAGRNVGLINAGMWVMPDDLPGELGELHGERLLTLLGDAPRTVMELIDKHGIECELERNGTLHCAVGAEGLKEIEARHAQWRRRGASVELLDAEETARRVGSAAYAGALLDRRAGTLQPLAYARGLAQAAVRAGVRLHTESPALSCETTGKHHRIRTPQGEVLAGAVIVATDAYSHGPWATIRREQVHLPYFNLATEPLGDNLRRSILPNREGVWDTKEILSSFRMDKAGRLVFGSVGALRGGGLTVHSNWAERALKKLFPQLGPVRFEAKWYGKIGMTTNALPRFHKFSEGIFGFCGYNGRGIAPGTVFGKILADLALGRISEADLPLPVTDPREPPMRQFKEVYYEAGAQVAHFADARRS